MKTKTIKVRVPPELKRDSKEVLAWLGMTLSDAIRMFLTQVVARKEFPVELKVPNEVTLKAMAERPVIHLDDEDWDELQKVLRKPSEPTEDLKSLFTAKNPNITIKI